MAATCASDWESGGQRIRNIELGGRGGACLLLTNWKASLPVRTILIIDDDADCRGPAAEILRRLGWNVIEAGDGEAGLVLALEHRPEVILCDLLMPRGNGFHVCRAVRERMELRGTRIIVCTGRDYPTDRKMAEEAGADEYLVKPIAFSLLEEALVRMAPSKQGREEGGAADAAESGEAVTEIKFWGVRGSIPTPGSSTVFFGGNTSCVEVRTAGKIIILDAGSGIRPLGQALSAEFGQTPLDLTLLMTHTHWDHIQGFPFFLPAYEARNKLRILGFEGARDGLAATMAGQMESPYFPIALAQMPGNIVFEELKEMKFAIGEIQAEACFTNHPGICVGYRLSTAAGSVVYMPDNETFRKDSVPKNAHSLPCTIEGKLVEFLADADVLIADTQYTADEYKEHVGWGHGCVDEVVRLAVSANVRRLFLFHHDPSHDDRAVSSMLMHARALAREAGSTMRVDAAREGETVSIGALTPVDA